MMAMFLHSIRIAFKPLSPDRKSRLICDRFSMKMLEPVHGALRYMLNLEVSTSFVSFMEYMGYSIREIFEGSSQHYGFSDPRPSL